MRCEVRQGLGGAEGKCDGDPACIIYSQTLRIKRYETLQWCWSTPPPQKKMHHVSVIYPYGTRFIRQPSSSNRYAFYWILFPHKIHVLKFCVVKILISYISVSSEDLHLLARSVKYFITIAERVIIYIFFINNKSYYKNYDNIINHLRETAKKQNI